MQIFSRLPWIDLAWLVGGRFEDCREEMGLLADWLAQIGALGPTAMPKGGESWSIETAFGATIRTLSSARPERLASPEAGCRGACVRRASKCRRPTGRPTPAPRPKDALLILAGTQENVQPWYSDLYDRWRMPNDEKAMAWTIAAWDNPFLYPGAAPTPKSSSGKQHLPRRIFEARFAGTRPRPTGLVYDEYDDDIHTRLIEVGREPDRRSTACRRAR